jgi:hypothetical protein
MSTSIQFLGKTYASVAAMPPDVRETYQDTPLAFNGTDYDSVAAMPPSVRAAFEVAYQQHPEKFEDLTDTDEDETGDDAEASVTAAPAWGGARPAGSVPVPAEFQAVTGLGPAVEVSPHKGLNLLPKFGTPRATTLVRYRDGMAYRAAGPEVHAWRWEEVAVIQTNTTRHPEKNNSWTSHEYTLTKASGEQLILDDELKGVGDAAFHIKTAVFAKLRPALKQRYQAGEALTFGPVTVSQPSGLQLDGKTTYAWDSIEDVKVEHGQLKVTLRNKQKHAAHTSAIPNVELLCQLIGVQLDDYQLAAEGLF